MIGIIANTRCPDVAKNIERIKSYLEYKKLPYSLIITSTPESGKKSFEHFLEKGVERVVLIGGDGTVMTALQSFLKSKKRVPIGIIPLGSGNDFYKIIEPKKLNIKRAMEIAFTGKSKHVDVGILQFNDRERIRKILFCNGCGFGLDSKTAVRSESVRFLRGDLRYFVALFMELIPFKGEKVRVEAEEFKYDGEITLITFGNGKFVGGGFQVTPLADAFDGLLDVSLFKKVNRVEVLQKLPLVLKGNHLDDPSCIYTRVREVKIHGKPPFIFHLDGEIYRVPESPVQISAIPKFFELSVGI